MAYQPNIPTGSVPLNQDYLNLKGNFQELNSQFLVDHVPLTDTSGIPPNGYHTVVHLVPFATNPPTAPPNYPVVAGVNGPPVTAGYGQLFDITINDAQSSDQSLYYLSGGGLLTQMTRNFQPLAAANGYTFLPGGLIMQWGLGSSNVNTPFNIAFTNAFVVNVTPAGSQSVSPSPAVTTITIGSPGFFISKNSLNQSYTFYWTAIGN